MTRLKPLSSKTSRTGCCKEHTAKARSGALRAARGQQEYSQSGTGDVFESAAINDQGGRSLAALGQRLLHFLLKAGRGIEIQPAFCNHDRGLIECFNASLSCAALRQALANMPAQAFTAGSISGPSG